MTDESPESQESQKAGVPQAGMYEVSGRELFALATELSDSLAVLVAIAQDFAAAGDEGAADIMAFLLHRDDETDAISSLYERIPELGTYVDTLAHKYESVLLRASEPAADGKCADYPNCSCGAIEQALSDTEGPLQ